MYADHIILLAENELMFLELLDIANNYINEFCLTYSQSKSSVMVIIEDWFLGINPIRWVKL